MVMVQNFEFMSRKIWQSATRKCT